MEMPRYVSHKKVWALEIDAIGPQGIKGGSATLVFRDKGYAPIEVPGEMFSRYSPVAGDFYVVYANDYKSFSPRKEFLEGYKSEKKASDIKTEHIAAACHQANKALCDAFGDTSQVDWKDAPQWQRDSAITGVKFCMNNPTAPPSANHDSWMKEKVASGWVHGAVKDAGAKTHPCIVPYDQLPPDQKAKDYVFKAMVAALA